MNWIFYFFFLFIFFLTVPPAQVWLGQCGSLHHSRFFLADAVYAYTVWGYPKRCLQDTP